MATRSAMSVFAGYEQDIIRRLVADRLPKRTIETVLASAARVSVEHTGVGYFVTARHPALPARRQVYDQPLLIGRVDGIEVGFVVFIENRELTLECHVWGDESLPADVRERGIEMLPERSTDGEG